MNQEIYCENKLDDNGNPSGGSVVGIGIEIRWQDGPLGRGADRIQPNGAFVEGVIASALNRLEWYQTASDGRFKCAENQIAITALNCALAACALRTQKREERQVEGTHQA